MTGKKGDKHKQKHPSKGAGPGESVVQLGVRIKKRKSGGSGGEKNRQCEGATSKKVTTGGERNQK